MIAKTILIVEDEADHRFMLQTAFESRGYRVFSAGEAREGLSHAREKRPDLIVLDIMMPGMDGLEFCRLIRRESKVPILFLTARAAEADKVKGFGIGGDDYVTKPFSMVELLARVEALLRRAEGDGRGPGKTQKSGIEIDVERREVRVRGKTKNLTPREFALLVELRQAEGKVLSRESILRRVWGPEKMAKMSLRTVDQHVARMRRKLKPEGHRIVTVTKTGYKLNTD